MNQLSSCKHIFFSSLYLQIFSVTDLQMEGSFVKVMELSEINLGECHKRHTRDSGADGESEPGI